jgi:hypothetical protein
MSLRQASIDVVHCFPCHAVEVCLGARALFDWGLVAGLQGGVVCVQGLRASTLQGGLLVTRGVMGGECCVSQVVLQTVVQQDLYFEGVDAVIQCCQPCCGASSDHCQPAFEGLRGTCLGWVSRESACVVCGTRQSCWLCYGSLGSVDCPWLCHT